MNSTTSLKLKKLFITMLSFLLAFCLIFTCACNDETTDDDGDDDTTEETTISDAQTLNNGDFEFYTTENTVYPYSSSVKWTRSNDSDKSTAPSSSYSSGIIDVSETAYGKLDNKNKPLDTVNSTDTDKKYLNPNTPYYYGLIDNKYDADDEDTYVNANTSGTKILMIHNELSSTPNHGTAQYFKSSTTLNVAKNSYGKFSVWIKTQNLNSNMLPDGEYGAYILLENSVNSTSYNNIIFNNINTNGEWALFEIYINGDELFDSTFKVRFGLGQGNGTNHTRFVEGFAYFDNAKFETYTQKEFTQPTNAINKDVTNESEYDIDLSSIDYASNGDKKDYVANNSNYTTTSYQLNYKFIPNYTALDMGSVISSYNENVKPTGSDYILSNGNKLGAGSVNSVKSTLSTLSKNALSDIEKIGNANPNLIYFDFANPSTASQSIENLTINAKSYIRYTFYSKIKITNSSANKFKVEVIDTTSPNNEKKTAVFSSLDTTTVKDGDYGTWEKYDIYVANVTDANVTYSLKFTFGIDEGKIAQNAELTKGYAFIADLKSYTANKETNEKEFENYEQIYSSLSNSSYLYKINLLGAYTNYEDEEEETETADSYSISVDLSQQFEIRNNPVTDIENNYKFNANNDKTVYGIINTKYLDNYTKNVGDVDYLKNTLASDESLQLLMLNNTENANSYYETYKSSVSTYSVLKIAVTVAVTGDAKAYVNLLVKDDDKLTYGVATISGDNWSKNVTVNATQDNLATLGQKFITLTMYVATGNRGFDYKLQIGNEGVGAVYIKSIVTVNATESDYITQNELLKDDFDTIEDLKFSEEKYTRAPATVKYLDEDGNEAETTRTFEPAVAFSGNNLYKFINYSMIDAEEVIDEREEVEEEEEEEDPTNPTYVNEKDVTLEIVSIILSVVLLGVLVTVLVRNIVKNRRKKIVKTKNYYSRDSREKALNAISEKKKNINVDDDDEEYDYSLAEKVGEEDDTVTEEIIDLETLEQGPIDDSQIEDTTDDSQTEEQSDDTPTDGE